MTIERKLLGTSPVSGEILPEAVSFDGTNDNLYRSSDLAGNADGKTFTISFWVYHDPNAVQGIYRGYKSQNNLDIRFSASDIIIEGKYSNSLNLSMYSSGALVPKDTWVNIIISIDMANTSRRFVYMNDVDVTSRFTFATYNNGLLSFTYTNHYIGSRSPSSSRLHGRLANFFMDRTYRDLSTTSNRRLFIDDDGKPSSTIPSNPIIYLPMTDADTAGSNSGTGGDFSVTGLLATAERGPNQDNCVASVFDGSADYLFRSSIAGVSSTKQFTFSFNFVHTGGTSSVPMEFRNASGTYRIRGWSNASSYNIYIVNNGSAVLAAHISNADYKSLNVDTGYKNNNVSISFDLSDTNKRYVYINGTAATVTWETYTNQLIDMSQLNNWRVGNSGTGSAWWNGQLGEVYFNTAYTDLATSNPFWDSDANRPNSVRKVIADTSVTPLIALPIIGSDAGNNLGSGGDFTVNSGPYTGARGGSEFYARSIEGTGASGISLTGGALSGGASSSNLTVVFNVYLDSRNSQKGWFGFGGNHFLCYNDSGGSVFIGNAYADSVVLISNSSSPFSTGSWHTVLWSMVSNGTSSQRHIYVDGVSASNQAWTQTRATFDLTAGTRAILSDNGGGQNLDGKISGLYVDQTYTDFSQESNRNKFIDQLGYPIDLGDDGSKPTGSSPLIYMKFDPSSLGTNVGTGGNYTVNGAVIISSDFTP